LSNDKSFIALLTSTELEWLRGKKKVQKFMNIELEVISKKKLQVFQVSELPLLAQNGFINELNIFIQLSANTQNQLDVLSLVSNRNNNDSPYEKRSLGRDFPHVSMLLDPRPFTYQGLVTYCWIIKNILNQLFIQYFILDK
jgi:hypothetical protein